MKTLYLDCSMGAAGDMLAAALLELLPDPDAFVAELNALAIPDVKFSRETSVKCGITGTHLQVTVHGEEEDAHDHHHAHSHDHHHDHAHAHHHDHAHIHHHHASLHDIEHIVRGHLSLPATVADNVMAVYRLIADAESKAHGKPVSEIHFHEVGTMDAIADITAVCLLMHRLVPDEIIVSPVHVGSGQVHCAHGILPVPAPATATILQDVPIYGGSIQGELCTPTGAALLKHFANSFGDMPVMRTSAIGYGMGQKDFPAANCVRALLGERSAASDDVIEICCNIYYMTGEAIGYDFDKLFAAGALDVYTIPIGMKKSRPGHLLHVICREADKDALVRALFAHTTTIGIRENRFRRYTLDRRIETIETADGPVRRKCSTGYGVSREKFEHDDLARIADAQGLSLREAEARVRKQLS